MADAYAAPSLDLYGSRPLQAQQRLLTRIRECFAQAEEYEAQNRRDQVAWLKFRAGEQWEPQDKGARQSLGRPCLTVNTLPQSEHQITNEMRLNMPSLSVLPVGDGADVETANILKGLIRHCNERSHADMVRETAFNSAVRIGAGYYRLCLVYDEWDSFDQEPRLAALRNQFACYLDPAGTSPVGRDAAWGFIFEHHDTEAFKEQWGIDSSTMHAWQSPGDTWVFRSHVRVAEYFWQDRQRVTLAELQDGSTVILEEVLMAEPMQYLQQAGLPPERLQQYLARLVTPSPRWAPLHDWMQEQAQYAHANLAQTYPPEFAGPVAAVITDLVQQIRRVRPTEYTTVRWVKTNGHVILEESIWPGKHIPLLRVVGEELDLDNRVQRQGIIANALDPMRLKNYFTTMMAEHVALAPMPGWVLDPRQIQGHEYYWRTANRLPHAYLPYNASGAGMQNVPPPTRPSYEPPIQGIALTIQMIEQDIQQCLGIYQGNVGAPSKERSGKAIAEKDRQADTGTYHFVAHLGDTMRYEGEQYVDLIPKTLSPGKIQRILGDDGSPQMVRLTASPEERQQVLDQPQQLEGLAGVYDLSSGSYDVLVDIGPSYATKRQEAAEQMLSLVGTLPEAMAPVIAQVVEKMDWEGARELAALLKQLPGQILPEGGTNKDAQLAQARQQAAQMQQQLQALDALAQQQQQQLAQMAAENQQLKTAHDLEALKVQDTQQDTRLAEWEAQQKWAIEHRKLLLEERKLDLEQQQLDIEREYKQATVRTDMEPVS
jgi:hypothetical protein